MRKTIWKYELQMKGKQIIFMQKGAEILSVQMQKETPCIWAIVNKENETEERCFEIFSTGDYISYEENEESDFNRKFIGTFQLTEINEVYHLFERVGR